MQTTAQLRSATWLDYRSRLVLVQLLSCAGATRDFQFVANVWGHADPELQPFVREAREAREAVQRLRGGRPLRDGAEGGRDGVAGRAARRP